MKKAIIAISALVLAFGAQAAIIVDPGFELPTGTDLEEAVGSKLYATGSEATDPVVQANYGWLASSDVRANGSFDAANDALTITTATLRDTYQAAIGQIVTGTSALSDAYAQITVSTAGLDANDVATVRVTFYSWDGGDVTTGNTIDLLNGGVGAGWTLRGTSTITDIAKTSTVVNGSTFSMDAYDKVGVMVQWIDQSGTIGFGDSLTVEKIDVVPEPATVGMLGLGALVTLYVRKRTRRKS